MYTHYVSAHFAAFDVIPEWPDDVTHTDHTKIHIPKESLLTSYGLLGHVKLSKLRYVAGPALVKLNSVQEACAKC